MLYNRTGIHDSQQLELRAASGYPNYAKMLTSTITIAKTLSEFRDKNILEGIANTNYGAQIIKPGQVIRFRHRVRGSLHRYQINQRLKTDTLGFRYVETCMNRALYASLKVDHLDLPMSEMKTAIAEWRSSLAEEARDLMLYEIIAHVIFDVPAYAQGNAAGYRENSGRVDLGSDYRPWSLSSLNALDAYTIMSTYAMGANWPESGNWAIIDYDMYAITKDSPTFSESCCLNDLDKNSRVSGKLPVMSIQGFKLHVWDKVPRSPSGHRILLFGNKAAISYGSNVVINRQVDPSEDFSRRFQWLWLYGFGIIERHLLAFAIWSAANIGNGGIHTVGPHTAPTA